MESSMMAKKKLVEEEEEEVEDQLEDWDDWNTDEEEESDPDFLCLFCESKFGSLESILEHCSSSHFFDFNGIRMSLGLDFYGSFKLINYVRSQVAENRCWSCGTTCESNKDLQNHLHEATNLTEDSKLLWEDEKYLKPLMQEDSLLHNFGEDEDYQEDYNSTSVYDEELIRELMNSEDLSKICIDNENMLDTVSSGSDAFNERRKNEPSSSFNGSLSTCLENVENNGDVASENIKLPYQKRRDRNLKASFAGVVEREIKNANESYFGAYSSFGIHREMISDKVRMEAYGNAILKNPALMNHAVVMDVGCGTGILSLFAAKAGASRVIAIEASEKMAKVAAQIAKDNGQLKDGCSSGVNDECSGVISIVQGMVEEVDNHTNIPPHSVDVLLSEWMGYCLLYESMLSSVLFARDRWLKPGGAILPDTATIFAAGFGRGGTSIHFWENVYGFRMSCIGKEVHGDSAGLPIVDVIDSRDIVTNTVVVQDFDLLTMTPDEMDFTANFELKLKSDHTGNDTMSAVTWCYGIVLWFETGFTSRFCKEMPTVLSTSPYTPKTHWSQTILTFQEPIAMALQKPHYDDTAIIGTYARPAAKIQSRISIVRATQHRTIEISLETAGISSDGQKRKWPVQIMQL